MSILASQHPVITFLYKDLFFPCIRCSRNFLESIPTLSNASALHEHFDSRNNAIQHEHILSSFSVDSEFSCSQISHQVKKRTSIPGINQDNNRTNNFPTSRRPNKQARQQRLRGLGNIGQLQGPDWRAITPHCASISARVMRSWGLVVRGETLEKCKIARRSQDSRRT